MAIRLDLDNREAEAEQRSQKKEIMREQREREEEDRQRERRGNKAPKSRVIKRMNSCGEGSHELEMFKARNEVRRPGYQHGSEMCNRYL